MPNIEISRADLVDMVHGFVGAEDSPAEGLRAMHDAVAEAFAHVDLPEGDRARINDFMNALHSLYEHVGEQDQQADKFYIEPDDLADILKNFDCFGMALRIQHSEFHHYDISNALLWAKSTLKRLAKRWGA